MSAERKQSEAEVAAESGDTESPEAVADNGDDAALAEAQAKADENEGSEATCKLLKTTLERFGISEVDPEGEPFDPELHEAMSIMPAPNAEPGSVVQVVQKGYALNDRLLRPARVIVAAEAPQRPGDS